MKKETPQATIKTIVDVMTIVSLMVYVGALVVYIHHPNPGIVKIGITAMVIWMGFRFLKTK